VDDDELEGPDLHVKHVIKRRPYPGWKEKRRRRVERAKRKKEEAKRRREERKRRKKEG